MNGGTDRTDPAITNSEGETALDMARGRAVKELLRSASDAGSPRPGD